MKCMDRGLAEITSCVRVQGLDDVSYRTYELSPGNTMDQSTLIRSVEELKTLYNLDKITVVADRGLNSGANLEHLCSGGHDFVISYTLKRSAASFKELVWDEGGWTTHVDPDTGELLSRSKIVEQTLEVKVPIAKGDVSAETKKRRGRSRKYSMEEIPVKIHLTWSGLKRSMITWPNAQATALS